MSVAKGWDDLWVGVICQSNPEIAGSPRNIFKYSVCLKFLGVEHWMAIGGVTRCYQSNSEYQEYFGRQSECPG